MTGNEPIQAGIGGSFSSNYIISSRLRTLSTSRALEQPRSLSNYHKRVYGARSASTAGYKRGRLDHIQNGNCRQGHTITESKYPAISVDVTWHGISRILAYATDFQ
jgi:hypothetical protein